MTNGDRIVANKDLLNQEADDSLAFRDTKRFGGATQASQEYCEGFCQAKERSAVVDLICDCLKFGTECLLALTQCRHAFPQLLNGQKPFLIGGEKSFDQAPPLAVAFRLVGQALRAEERTPCTSHSIARGHVRRDLSVHQPLQLLPIAIAGIGSDGLRILTLPLTTGRTSQDAYARLTTMPEM